MYAKCKFLLKMADCYQSESQYFVYTAVTLYAFSWQPS